MPLVRISSGTSQAVRMNYLPKLLGWSVALGSGVLYMGECIPRLKKDIFYNIPLIGNNWEEYKDWKI
ncbi:hypothetical protein MP228_013019 [Amoeboaphelidium protococcarum]|nr:hypothetical protein MP228_013019 [Amoeboaphelidium protococcarum]